MLYFLVLTNFLVLFLTVYLIWEDKEILKLLAVATAFFFVEYVVVSGLYFLVDRFEFITVMLTCTALTLFMLGGLLYVKRQQVRILFGEDLRCEFLLLAILVATIPFIYQQNELYSLGQDQGVYQATAIVMMNGDTSVQYDFPEYELIESEEDQNTYQSMVDSTLLGFYPMNTKYPTVDTDDILSDVLGIFHGVQTFPAILALWGSLFGITAMMRIQMIFYLAAVVLTYYTIKSFTQSKWTLVTATSILAFSPLIIWLSKSSYTEMFLTLLFATYIFLLTEENKYKWLLGLPLLSFGFFHVSYLLILPIFVLVHLILYIKEQDVQYLTANYIAALGLGVGYYMMSVISPQYFFDNCSRLYVGTIITSDNFMCWMYFASIVIIVTSLLVKKYVLVCKRILENKYLPYLPPIISIILLSMIVRHGLRVSFFRTSLYAFAIVTGFCIVPPIICMIIFGFKKLYAHKYYLTYALMFGYMILFHCAYIRQSVRYYYYYARYLGFYIPIICICWVILLELYKNKFVKFVIPVISLLICLRYDVSLMTAQDDTATEWSTLLDLTEVIDENAVIVSNDSIIKDLGVPLRATSDVALFPMFDDLESQMQMLQSEYDHVYILMTTGNEWDGTIQELGDSQLTLQYMINNTYSKYDVSYTGQALPTKVIQYDTLYMLYEYFSSELIGEFNIDFGAGKNFERMDSVNWNDCESTFTWSKEQSGIYFETYNLEDDIQLEMESFTYGYSGDTMVYLNGNLVEILENHELQTNIFTISREYLDESGEQYLEFVTLDATTPEKAGQSIDTRTLGLAILNIKLEQ